MKLKYITLSVLIIALFCIFSIGLTSCESGEKEESIADSISHKNVTPLSFTDDRNTYVHPDCNQVDSVENCTHIVITTVKDLKDAQGNQLAEIKKQINQAILKLLSNNISEKEITSLDSLKNVFFESWTAYSQHVTDKSTIFPWEIKVTGSSETIRDSLLSYQLNAYSFTGGAHGNAYRKYLTFNLKYQHEFNPLSIVEKEDFRKIAEKYFRQKVNITPDADLDEEGFFFDNGKFHLPDEIGLSRKGIVLYYNDYEIRPHSEGPLKVVVPWEELK